MQDLPNIMPFQLEPFNGDTFVQDNFLKLRDKYHIKTIVETGTAFGGTTKFLCENFEEVYSVEVNKKYYDIAEQRLCEFKNLGLINADSSNALHSIVDFIISINYDKSVLFFLDAHWENKCPLIEELNAISKLNKSGINPIIVIHDFKVPNEPQLGYDSYNGQEFTFKWIKPHLDNIYGIDNYTYFYNTNETSTQVKRGVIYIEPKIN